MVFVPDSVFNSSEGTKKAVELINEVIDSLGGFCPWCSIKMENIYEIADVESDLLADAIIYTRRIPPGANKHGLHCSAKLYLDSLR